MGTRPHCLFLSAWQDRFDRASGASREAIEETNRRLEETARQLRPIDVRHGASILGLAFAGAVLAVAAGERLPALGDPTIISNTTWAVLIVVTGGLLLSFTPARRLEEAGAPRMGYVALYLLLTAIGAQADLKAVLAAPQIGHAWW